MSFFKFVFGFGAGLIGTIFLQIAISNDFVIALIVALIVGVLLAKE